MQDALPDIALDQIGRFRSAMSVLSVIRARIEPDPAPRSGPKRPDFETSDFCRAERAVAKMENLRMHVFRVRGDPGCAVPVPSRIPGSPYVSFRSARRHRA